MIVQQKGKVNPNKNPKSQAPNPKQIQIPKYKGPKRQWAPPLFRCFGFSILVLVWDLGFGAWDFCLGP
jgi:hypothetical protein